MTGIRQSIIARLLVLSVLALGLASCGIITRNADVKPWIGRPANELLSSRGQPERIEPDGKGNRIFVYEWTWESQSQTPGRVWHDAGGTHYTSPTTSTIVHRERRMFYVDSQGKIVDAKWSWW